MNKQYIQTTEIQWVEAGGDPGRVSVAGSPK